jgi:hypothetical protein
MQALAGASLAPSLDSAEPRADTRAILLPLWGESLSKSAPSSIIHHSQNPYFLQFGERVRCEEGGRSLEKIKKARFRGMNKGKDS